MCWNKDVSLNTFLFSSFVLLMVIYNNEYTSYKIKELDDVAVYIFVFSVIIMQLIEYFIWNNLSNKRVTKMWSYAGMFVAFLQPIAAIFILKNKLMRWNLLLIYFIISAPLFIHSIFTFDVNVGVSEVGHLIWKYWYNDDMYLTILRSIYLLIVFYVLITEQKYIILSFGLITLLWSMMYYLKSGTMGSMWCWAANSFAIFSAFYLLFYLPFQEKMLCK